MSKLFASYSVNEYSIYALKILSDNFVYIISKNNAAILIDAGEAKPILNFLSDNHLKLQQILITHDHLDHTGGCLELQNKLGVSSRSPGTQEEKVSFLDTTCQILATPGHTAVHKSFYFPELNVIFTGDVLINGACGRLLGGTIDQLYKSLKLISNLPNTVQIFGGHDYLEENLRFASYIMPSNRTIKNRQYLYKKNKADALFVNLKEELKTNPFMLCESKDELSVLRKRKDVF